MNFEVGKVYNGFELTRQEKVDEIDSIARIFYHKKSGARLLSIENDDDNKVFSVSFRTPPKDSTGVAHILEHSVLCGSRKFPVKEPFVELAKGSLNTFLNAMTFSDKTMYPIASKNEKDFTNLMDVYLDAVFYPNIYKEPQIMMQEGWHYELDNKDGELSYKGVVYNEMKGAFSSPEAILFRKISQTLFPNTIYGVESGGDPNDIPNLTQEEFTDFHKKYYHPSNSYIFLYGDMDVCEKLKFLDENYLNDFDKIDVDSTIKEEKSFDKMVEAKTEYPISQGESEENKTFLSLNYVVGNCKDTDLYAAFDILEYILLEEIGAPLKRALIDAKLGKDVFGVYDNGVLQPTFSIVVKNSDEDKKEKFKEVVKNTLKKLVDEGIDKKSIEGAINRYEFQLRENDYNRYPKGLVFNIKSLDTWLYNEDPLVHLKYEKILKKIKTALTTNYFEKLIEEYLLKNNHSSLLIVSPKKGLEEERSNSLRGKLSEYKESLSESELNKIIEDTKKLKERQTSGDSKEDLSKIPLLSLDDIEEKTEKLPLTEKKYKDIKVLHSPIFTNKINYTNLIFNTDNVPEELISYLPILSKVLGEVNTKQYNYEKLSQEININTGGIEFSASAYFYNNDAEEFYPHFMVRTKALNDKLEKVFDLTGEILTNSLFDDKNRIKEIIDELKSRLEMTIFDRGHIVAANRALSYISKGSKYMELLNGISLYKFVSDIEKNFNDISDTLIENLNKLVELIFNKNNLLISVTCSEDNYKDFEENIEQLYRRLGDKSSNSVKYELKAKEENEGIKTSAKVQYVSKVSNFIKLGYKYTGSMKVLKNIATLDYLWNKVRVQGGAYGAMTGFQRSGNMLFTSYRDPNLSETIDTYDKFYKYLENFDADEREMTKYIIGTISELDSPMTAQMKGERATADYLRKVTYEDSKKEREEVLNTKVEDIRKLSSLIKKATAENHICVVGNEEKIMKNKNLFNTTINLFE